MKKVLLLIAVIFSTAAAFAQMSDVTLTVIGTGATEEIATQNALRRALEEAYGAFLVSRTSIVMDELASDEIVVNTNGQVKELKQNAISTLPNGHISVSITATVSMQEIISYAQGKGCEVAFMGDAFVANLKMMQLKVDNATKTLKILTEQIEDLSEDLFSFELSMGSSPVLINIEDKEYYVFKGQLNVYSNYASHHFYNLLHNTLSALQLNTSERDFFKRTQLPISRFTIEYGESYYDGIPIQQDTLDYYRARIMTSTYNAITRVNVQEISKNKTHDCIWNSLNYWDKNDRRGLFGNFYNSNILLPQSSFKLHEFHYPVRNSLTEKEHKLLRKGKYTGVLCTDSVVYMENLITRIVFPLYIPKESMATFQGFKLNGKQVFSPSNLLTADNPQFLEIMKNYCKFPKYYNGLFYRAELEIYNRMPFKIDDITTEKEKNYNIIRNERGEDIFYYAKNNQDGKLIFKRSKLYKPITLTPEQRRQYILGQHVDMPKPELASDFGEYLYKACCFLNGIDTSIEDSRFIFLTIHIDGHRPRVHISNEYHSYLYIDSYHDNNGNYHGVRRIRLD